jgi:hypothetical protein
MVCSDFVFATAWANRARRYPERVEAHPGVEDDRPKMIGRHGSGIGTPAATFAHHGEAPAIDPRA